MAVNTVGKAQVAHSSFKKHMVNYLRPTLKSKTNNLYLIYDSECLMCNSFVSFVDQIYSKTRDSDASVNVFVYPSIDSFIHSSSDTHPKKFTKEKIIPSRDYLAKKSLSTLILIDDQCQFYFESRAIANILISSNSKIAKVVGRLIAISSSLIGDIVYKMISRIRLIFNKYFRRSIDSCKLHKNIVVHR